MSTLLKCDRCGKNGTEPEADILSSAVVYLDANRRSVYDLCRKCREDLIRWVMEAS